MKKFSLYIQKDIISTLCLFFLFCFVNAQTIDPSGEILSHISNYTPINNQNWNISQNRNGGLMYFANSSGLIEYNGISVKTYSNPLVKGVRSVYVADDGTVYTGSFEEFGFWKKSVTGNLTYTSLVKSTNVEKNDEIWKIYELNGTIYFQSFTTIYCFDQKTTRAIMAPFTMLFLFQTGDKFIAQVLTNGLYWFDGNDYKFIENSEFLKRIEIHSILKITDHEYWICTTNNGIYKFDGVHFKYFDTEISRFLIYQTCNAGLLLSDSSFVFGTILNGLVFCDNNGRITKKINYSNGLRNNTVLSLFKGFDNGLWIGLDDGVNYINLLSPATVYTNSSGTIGTIYSAIMDKNKLYLGTNHGLFVSEISNLNENFSFSNIRFIPLTQGQVWTLGKFNDQIICGHNEGTFCLKDQKFNLISEVTGGWSIIEYGDLLLEGTYTGVVLFRKDDEGRWVFRNKIKGFSEPSRHIEIDYLGYIWVSHPQKGIFQLEMNEALDSVLRIGYFKNIGDDPILDICKINNQIIFITSHNVYTFDYTKKAIVALSILNSTLNDYKRSTQIIQQNNNNYWFIKENKIALYKIAKDFTADKLLELDQKSTDLPERELNILQLSDKTILIPTREAFTTYNLSALNTQPGISKLSIDKLLFQGKSRHIELATDSSRLIEVPYNYNNLTAHFSDPSNFDEENKSFLYHMTELDDNWHRTSVDSLTYLHLSYGSYHLQVKPEYGNSTVSIAFVINKPWYLTYWAFISYFLISVLLLWTGMKIFRIEIKRARQLIDFEINNTKLASELDFKSYELMLTMRYLFQKNEIMSRLRELIAQMREQSSKYSTRIVNDMEKIVNNGLDSQTEEWRNTMNNLKLSQEGFFNRLMKKHPNLTPNDLRICSYLRMNFNTKEIAKLLNISGRAVEISRYRLRRKMNLDHNINLTEYLIKHSEDEV